MKTNQRVHTQTMMRTMIIYEDPTKPAIGFLTKMSGVGDVWVTLRQLTPKQARKMFGGLRRRTYRTKETT